MEDCLFCDVIKGNVTSYKVWEDENYLAILDIFPIRTGQAIVMPKQHMKSYVFNLPDDLVSGLYLAAKKVARLLDLRLGSERIVQLMEGLGVNHAHIKLYPIMNSESEGGLLPVGQKANAEDLVNIAKKITEGGMK